LKEAEQLRASITWHEEQQQIWQRIAEDQQCGNRLFRRRLPSHE
jgi:hypothetical protein